MNLAEFDYELPEDRIALRPVRPRSAARLLIAGRRTLRDRRVRDLVQCLAPGDRLVLNNTRVLPAQLSGLRTRPGAEAGARIGVTLVEPISGGHARALARPLSKLRVGDRLSFAPGLAAEVAELSGGQVTLAFAEGTGEAALAETGAMPLPPYIAARRPADASDRGDYQSVFARHAGAVAAPTASLHFDDALLARLRAAGIGMSEVTLHVGAGTFLPVKTETVEDHRMHAERGEIGDAAAAEINAARAAGGRIVPVGTTALRLLETAADAAGRVHAWSGATDIFIRPGHVFRATDALMTNFHQPRSTLMVLVAALMGRARVREIYAHALAEGYRFLSYGDASLLMPDEA